MRRRQAAAPCGPVMMGSSHWQSESLAALISLALRVAGIISLAIRVTGSPPSQRSSSGRRRWNMCAAASRTRMSAASTSCPPSPAGSGFGG